MVQRCRRHQALIARRRVLEVLQRDLELLLAHRRDAQVVQADRIGGRRDRGWRLRGREQEQEKRDGKSHMDDYLKLDIRRAELSSAVMLAAANKVAHHQVVEIRLHETPHGVLGRADDGLAFHVERGVQHNGHAGLCLKASIRAQHRGLWVRETVWMRAVPSTCVTAGICSRRSSRTRHTNVM